MSGAGDESGSGDGKKKPDEKKICTQPEEEGDELIKRALCGVSLDLHPRQQEFMHTRFDPAKKFVLYSGGVGSGKTLVGAYRFLDRAMRYPTNGYILANSYEQLEKVAVETVLHLAMLSNFQVKRLRGRREIRIDKAKAKIFYHSTQNIDMLRGVEMGFFWLDEARDTSREAWLVIQGRLREKYGHLKGDLTTTPAGISHWLYEEFASPEKRSDGYLVTGTSYDNPHLPQAYLRSLESSYAGEWFEQEVNAKFTNTGEGLCYLAFNRDLHVSGTVEMVPGETLHVGVDFNVSPMSAVFARFEDGRVEVFADWSERNSGTDRLVREIRAVAGDGTEVRVYPDASGANRRTAGSTDHALLRAAGFEIAALRRNPAQRDRVQTVNYAFRTGRLKISRTAKGLIHSLEATRWKKNKNEIDKEPNTEHLSDALGYLVCRLLPIEDTRTTVTMKKI